MTTFSKKQIGFGLFAIAIILICMVTKTYVLESLDGDTLKNGDSMSKGEMMFSQNGIYSLTFGQDGTLKIMTTDSKTKASKEFDVISNKDFKENIPLNLTFIDGNIAISTEDLEGEEKIKWQTNTRANGVSKAQLRNDGILVIIDEKGNRIWASGKIKEGFTGNGSSNSDASFNEMNDNQTKLQLRIQELNHLGNPSINVNKLQMDTTVYISIFWTVLATALLYYLATSLLYT